MRNKAGQLAVVVPWESADPDIKAHGGKIVTVVRRVACGLGPPAWQTVPQLYDAYGNSLGWDDLDLQPLGGAEIVSSETIAVGA